MWAQTGALEGIDQYVFNNPQRIYRADGNVWFGRDQGIQLNSILVASDAGKTATASMLIDAGTNIVLAGVATKLRRYSVSAGTWGDSTGTLAANALWLTTHRGRVFVALGSAQNAVYSSDSGDTFTSAAVKVNGFVSFKNNLYGWLANDLYVNSSKWGDVWSTVLIPVGNSSSNITNAVVAFGVLIIRKEDGLFYFDGTNVVELFTHPNTLYTGNTSLCFANDGFVYFNVLGRGKKFSMSSGAIANLVDVTPLMIGDANKELWGHGIPIWMWSGPGDALYVAFDDGESIYPEVLAYTASGWQQVYRGASGDTLRAGGYSRLAAFTFFNDGATRYRAHRTLSDQPAASYATSGVYETSDFDGGLPFMYKAIRDISLEGRNLAAGQTIKAEYSTDKGTTYVTIGTMNSDGKTTFTFDPTSQVIGALHVRLRFTLASNSSANTPVLIRFSVSFLTRPEPVYGYRFEAKLSEGQIVRNGRESLSVTYRINFLLSATASYVPLTFEDMYGTTKTVYISQLSAVQPALELEQRSDERFFKVTLVEAIAGNRWDFSQWDGGVWV